MHASKLDNMTSVWPGLSAKMTPLLCRSKDKEAKALQRVMCSSSHEGNYVCIKQYDACC